MTTLPPAVQMFDRDQRQAIQLLNDIIAELTEDISELEVLDLLEQRCLSLGFLGFIRRPVVHFNYRPSFRMGPSKSRQLKRGSVVQIHIQPYSKEAFGNIGVSFGFKTPDLPILKVAKELCIATSTFAGYTKKAGELVVFSQSWATNHLTELNRPSIGHCCFPNSPGGLIGSLWPRSMRLLTQMRRYQVQWYNPRPLDGIYALHPDIKQDNRRAGFAEMIWVSPEDRIVLGRESMNDLCMFPSLDALK